MTRPFSGVTPFVVGGVTVHLRPLTVRDGGLLERRLAADPGAVVETSGWVAARCLVDPAGGRLFRSVTELGGLPAAAVDAVAREGLRLTQRKVKRGGK